MEDIIQLLNKHAYNELIVWDFNTLEKIFAHKTKKSIRCTSLESNNIFVVTKDRMDIIDVDKLFIDKNIGISFDLNINSNILLSFHVLK